MALLLVGCATWQAPEAVDEAPWRARAVTESLQDVHLAAAVLSAGESIRLFGADVNATGIQPVWVEVKNGGEDMLWLLQAGTDPDYFSPLEVAWSFHAPLSGARNRAIDEHFDRLAFANPIPPGATRAGVIFTNPHHRIRVLNVDLLGRGRLVPFTLFLPVPDNPQNETGLQVVARYSAAAEQDFDQPEALRAALERLPCCARDAQGAVAGDPLNVVLVGQFDYLAAAMTRRGLRTDRRAIDDTQRVFGRRPDIVGRIAGQSGLSPHWVRLWVAPFRYRGQPVFVGQVGRAIGGRLAVADRRALVVHPNVDEVRNFLIQDLMYSGGLAKLGFVRAGGGTAVAQPADSLESSRYHTDGLRAVMFFVSRPVTASDVEILDWVPALELRETEARRIPWEP
jgi:hypothetical protein